MRFLLWPFEACLKLASTIVRLAGRFTAVVVGLILLMVGILLSMTIVGAIIGIPIFLLGFFLMVKGIF